MSPQDVLKNYHHRINNLVGTTLFKNFYLDGKDITGNGNTSCALVVSNIIFMMNQSWIGGPHATINSTEEDLLENGWSMRNTETHSPKRGDIVFWGPWLMSDHDHIGFVWDEQKAVSNDYRIGVPVEHSIDYKGKRFPKYFLTRPEWQ